MNKNISTKKQEKVNYSLKLNSEPGCDNVNVNLGFDFYCGNEKDAHDIITHVKNKFLEELYYTNTKRYENIS